MRDPKLYIRIVCFACDGNGLLNHPPHHNPLDIFQWKSCPYCDHDGTTLIEASVEALAERVGLMPETTKEQILRAIYKHGDVQKLPED